MMVDLPLPEGPTRKTNSPSLTSVVHTAQRVCPVLIFLLHVGQADHRRVLPFFSKFAYFILLYAGGEEMAIKIM